jgi:hypothetical protein
MAVAVAVGSTVGLAVGLGLAQSVRSGVHEAPSEGQQKSCVPQRAIVPTLAIVEQLTLCGASPFVTVLQLFKSVASPATGQASADGQTRAASAFSLISCCCLTRITPAATAMAKNTTTKEPMISPCLLLLPGFEVVTTL